MRWILISLIIFLGVTNSFSQPYIKMIDISNVWDVLCGDISTNGIDMRQTDKLQFIGDTVINDTIYYKLYSHTYITPTDSSLQYKAALREDTLLQRIYRRNDYGDSTETLLYDFSLNSGDSVIFSQFLNNSQMPIKVDSIKTIYFAGQNRRIFYIKEYYPLGNPWFPYACQWIEGFGRTKINGKMIGPIDDFEWYVNELLCFWKTGQLFYQNTTYWSCLIIHVGINETKGFDNLKIFPNPVKTELIIDNIPNSIENLFVIYNCLGQEMLRLNSKESSKQIDITNMPSGIYILKIINQDSMTVEKFIKK